MKNEINAYVGELKPFVKHLCDDILDVSITQYIRYLIRKDLRERGLLPKKALSSPMKTLTPKEK